MQKVKMEQIANIWSSLARRNVNSRRFGLINMRSRINTSGSLSQEIKEHINKRCLGNREGYRNRPF